MLRMEFGQTLLVVGIVIAGACATAPTMTPELGRAAANVKLIDGPPPAGHQLIAPVEHLSCARVVGTSPDMAAAREQLKIEAAMRGANAVASIVCQEEGVSFGDNCWKSVRCMGDAIRLQ
jgi:hypothetical protein